MRKPLKLIALIVSVIMTFGFTACVNSDEKVQEIRETFNSFENSDRYIFLTYDNLHIGKRVVPLSDITYEGNPCEIISLDKDGAYAYAYKTDSKTGSESESGDTTSDGESEINSMSSGTESNTEQTQTEIEVNVVFVYYSNLNAGFVGSFTLPDKVIYAEHYKKDIIFYCGHSDGEPINYYIFNLDSKTGGVVPSEDLEDFNLYSADHNRSGLFIIESYNNDDIISGLVSGNRLKITKRESGETRILDKSILLTCEEGEKILSFGEINCGGFNCAYEKDGYIYVSSVYITDGLFGEICHAFIFSYDFEKHTVKYYTSIELTDSDRLRDMFIP